MSESIDAYIAARIANPPAGVTYEVGDMPCGKSITTKHFNEAGELIRQDVEAVIDPDKLPKMGAEVSF